MITFGGGITVWKTLFSITLITFIFKTCDFLKAFVESIV